MGGSGLYHPPVKEWTGIATWEDHTNRGTPSTEPGVDWYCPRFTPLFAAASGVVVDTLDTYADARGRFIAIDLDDGHRARYLHLENRLVSVGDRVAWGQHIGHTGATGYGEADWSWNVAETGGAHVHETIFPNHRYVFGRYATLDPWPLTNTEMNDMGTLDATEANYQTFASFLQRALRYDVRTNGFGPDWKLGPTVFELLRAADDSGDLAGVKDAVGAIAVKMTAEDRAEIAKAVVDSLKIPTGGATKADVVAAVDAGLAKLVLKPATA